ncbi:MAG: hypothetical protein GX141_08585 [Armatimonadetes bacterium]|nr:hypothetical protein [Armatimonadota bacterium]
MPVYGIEEEVFITEPERPTLKSFYYLARLLAKNPKFYYTHSAHNFARGADVKQGAMGGVEISAAMSEDVEALADDLARRRADLSSVATGLIVPVGHLFDYEATTNTCAVHVHISGVADTRRLYGNLIHFLPILPLFTINSPMAASKYFGKSYRMAHSWAIGPIRDDWKMRFQDIIFSRRLGTIELRVCDPCWDINRIRWLLRAVKAISEIDETLDPRISRYNAMREDICREGMLDENAALLDELRTLVDFPIELIQNSPSDELYDVYKQQGLVGAYSALDNGYRNGVFEPVPTKYPQRSGYLKGLVGFIGYFLPRLPYYAWKGLKE